MKVTDMEFESFIDTAKDINGVLRVTIPAKISQFMGLKEGDSIRVMVKKVPKKEDKNELLQR